MSQVNSYQSTEKRHKKLSMQEDETDEHVHCKHTQAERTRT